LVEPPAKHLLHQKAHQSHEKGVLPGPIDVLAAPVYWAHFGPFAQHERDLFKRSYKVPISLSSAMAAAADPILIREQS
jgi:hypothetical protein